LLAILLTKGIGARATTHTIVWTQYWRRKARRKESYKRKSL